MMSLLMPDRRCLPGSNGAKSSGRRTVEWPDFVSTNGTGRPRVFSRPLGPFSMLEVPQWPLQLGRRTPVGHGTEESSFDMARVKSVFGGEETSCPTAWHIAVASSQHDANTLGCFHETRRVAARHQASAFHQQGWEVV